MARPRTRNLLLALGAALPLAAISVAACRGPTEVTVHIRTNVPCTSGAQWHGVAVYTGAPGVDVETRAPVLSSTACDGNGNIGSIVLVPSGAKDSTTSVRVVGGVTRPPEECSQHGYAGCIVERRSLSFLSHEALDVDIMLTSDCVGQPCDALSTCVAGVCIDAQLKAPPPSAADGSSGAAAPVRCGDEGLRCPVTGNVCCLTIEGSKTRGACMDAALCPPTSVVLRCDDESDCAGPGDDAGCAPVCCVDYQTAPGDNAQCPNVVHSSQCLPYGSCVVTHYNGALDLCGSRLPCQQQYTCSPVTCDPEKDALPGYFACRIPFQ